MNAATILEDMQDLRGRAAAGLLGHTDRDAMLIAKAVHAWEAIYKLGQPNTCGSLGWLGCTVHTTHAQWTGCAHA